MRLARPYQEDAVDSVLFGWDVFDKVLVQLGTGGGKTFIAAKIIESVLPDKCLYLADQDELCYQPLSEINRTANVIAALEKAKDMADLRARVVVASAQTLSRKKRLERYPEDHFKYIIVDECHRGSDRDRKVVQYFKSAKVLGLTATPFKSGLKDLSKYYNEVVFRMPVMNLIEEGYAPPVLTCTLPVEIDLDQVNVKRGEYDPEQVSTIIAPLYEKIIEETQKLIAGRSLCLVFLPLISSSKSFAEIARSKGIKAIHVDGTTENRKEIIEGCRIGRYDMVCNAGVLSTGVDIPNIDTFVNLCLTHSLAEYQQRFGRATRVLPGVIDGIEDREERKRRIAASAKPNTLVIDFLQIHSKLTVRGAESIIANSESEAKAFAAGLKTIRTPQQLAEIAKRIRDEKEKKLLEGLERVASKKRKIDPMIFAALTHAKDLLDYEPTSEWEIKPPSEQQLQKLDAWGFDIKKVTNAGLAKRLMGHQVFRFRYNMASNGQLIALSRAKAEIKKGLTRKEASDMISRIKISSFNPA